MLALQCHNQLLYHLTQLTNGFRPKRSSFAVRVNQPISIVPDILCQESFKEAKKNHKELPVSVMKAKDLPNILRLGSKEKEIALENILKVEFRKKDKKENKWIISYMSGASFEENKRGFPEKVHSFQIYLSKPLHRRLRKNIFDIQIREFKTQRVIKSEGSSNPSIPGKFMKWLGIPGNEQGPSRDLEAVQNLLKKDISSEERVKLAFAEGFLEGNSRKTPNKLMEWMKMFQVIMSIGIILLIVSLYLFRQGFMFKIAYGENMEVDGQYVTESFADIKGIDEAKEEMWSIVDYLKNPQKYTALGGKLPKGVLLSGPPGTGKTLLARALAGEAGVPFFHAAGPQFDEILVGQGAKRIRELFQTAKERAPCVIFIDEIDSVGSRRSTSVLHPYANQTINQLLSEMDGFHPNSGVIVLGATNRPNQLDPALMRPGRFDVRIHVYKPSLPGRRDIFELYLSKILHEEIDVNILARNTVGFTGADISNMVNQAALHAALVGAKAVTMEHISLVRDRILMGLRTVKGQDEEINKYIAYHESGHALVAYYAPFLNDVFKVTILPRGPSLGHTSFIPKRDLHTFTKSEILTEIDVCMGGRAAEELIFGNEKISAGASNDLKRANQIAESMVRRYGMSENFGLRVIDGKTTNEIMETEVRKILQQSYERAKAILQNHPNELKMLAEALLKYETLDLDDVKNLLQGKKMKIEGMSTTGKLERNIPENNVPVEVPSENVL